MVWQVLLSAARVVCMKSDPDVALLADRCLHHFFEKQVSRRPDAVAVRLERKQLTYREPDERVNRLGACLQDAAIPPRLSALGGVGGDGEPKGVLTHFKHAS